MENRLIDDNKEGATILAELSQILFIITKQELDSDMNKLIKKMVKSKNPDLEREKKQVGTFDLEISISYPLYLQRFKNGEPHQYIYKALINIMEDYYDTHPNDPKYQRGERIKIRETKKSKKAAFKYFDDNIKLFKHFMKPKNFDFQKIYSSNE